jgi:hypothetical protein
VIKKRGLADYQLFLEFDRGEEPVWAGTDYNAGMEVADKNTEWLL